MIFLQNWPVGCRVRGNLSERVFLLGFEFALVNIVNYNQLFEYDSYILRQGLVAIKVVSKKSRPYAVFLKFLKNKNLERWPSGLRQRFAKPSYRFKLVPRVRIPPSPLDFVFIFTKSFCKDKTV